MKRAGLTTAHWLLVVMSFLGPACGDDARGADAQSEDVEPDLADVREDPAEVDGGLEADGATTADVDTGDAILDAPMDTDDALDADADAVDQDVASADTADGLDADEAGQDVTPDMPVPDPEACNGHRELCERRFDEVTLATTHNAMNNAEEGWLAPNQQYGLTRQMRDGIRGMMLDTHEWNGEPYLCHGTCLAGSQLLVEGLAEIAVFLSDNPREVMAIIFQDAITPEQTEAAFVESGLLDFVYTHEGPWPTLQTMIDDGTRLVVGAEQRGPPPPWYHHAWDLWFDTPYNFISEADFSCELNRGSADNDLFLVNHWITIILPQPNAAPTVNASDVLLTRAQECESRWGRPINLLAVDFYADGDLLEVVDILNGVGEP